MMKRMAILLAGFLIFLSAQAAGAYELGSTGNVDIHGFISQGYIQTTDNNFFGPTEDGSFQFNEAGINFSSDVSDRLRVGLQFFARDFGSLGNNEVTIDWAFADYTFTEWANFRAGKIKMIHGLYNTSRDVDMLRTSVFLPQSVYNEGWRDSINAMNGFEYYGYAPAGAVGSFEYHAQVGTFNLDDDGAEIRLLEDQLPALMQFDVHGIEVESIYAGGFLWESPLEGLRMGASGWQLTFDGTISSELLAASPTNPPYVGPVVPDSIIDVVQTGWTTSIEYAIGDLVFSTEYNRINYDLDDADLGIDKDFDSEGYYGMLTYRFCDWFELGTYYSEYYANRDDKDGDKGRATWDNGLALDGSSLPGAQGGYPPGQDYRAYLKDLALSLRFDITENWILKVEGHKMQGSAIMLNSDDNTALYSGVMGPSYEEDWYLYTAKVSYSF